MTNPGNTLPPGVVHPGTRPILVGVSACLLGEHVRYDGGHMHDHLVRLLVPQTLL